MARTIVLDPETTLQERLAALGFDTASITDEQLTNPNDHPLPIRDNGDVYRVLRVVDRIQKEIAAEEAAMEEELAAVRTFRTQRIESRREQIDWLTIPLKKWIEENGNYNGPAGHAGKRRTWKTEWQASDDDLATYALEEGLDVRVSIKGKVPAAALRALRKKLPKDALVDVAADKGAVAKHEGAGEAGLLTRVPSISYSFRPSFGDETS